GTPDTACCQIGCWQAYFSRKISPSTTISRVTVQAAGSLDARAPSTRAFHVRGGLLDNTVARSSSVHAARPGRCGSALEARCQSGIHRECNLLAAAQHELRVLAEHRGPASHGDFSPGNEQRRMARTEKDHGPEKDPHGIGADSEATVITREPDAGRLPIPGWAHERLLQPKAASQYSPATYQRNEIHDKAPVKRKGEKKQDYKEYGMTSDPVLHLRARSA